MRKIIFTLLPLTAAATVFAGTLTVSVYPDKKHQVVDNFTAADAWSGNFVGQYFSENAREQIAQWLFSDKIDAAGNVEGIGLSMWRVNLGGGSLEQDGADIEPYQRRAESFLTKDGQNYDWGKCSGQQYFMKKARAYGANKFLLFSNTPLVQWTRNGKGYADKGETRSNLKPDCYQKFADYMADVAKHFQDLGYNIEYLSPVNEPQVPWDTNRQEGSPWRVSEIYKISVALDNAMTARGLDKTKILFGEAADLRYLYETRKHKTWNDIPESERPDLLLSKFCDPKSSEYLLNLKHMPKFVGGHSYHSHQSSALNKEVREALKKACDTYGVGYQETEWCMLPCYTAKNHGGLPKDWHSDNCADIYAALVLGRLVYGDFVYANSTAWGFWKGMEIKGDYALIGLYPEKGDLTKGGVARPNKMLWALGNFSLFVRPGFSRIDLTGADDLDTVAGLAFAAPDAKRIVSIFVNSSNAPYDLALSLPASWAQRVETVRAFRTDPRMDMGNLHVKNKDDVTLAPLSITTVVVDLK